MAYYTERTCKICGSKFMSNNPNHFYCSDKCRAIKSKQWNQNYYQKNKEKINTYAKQWQKEHPSAVKETAKKWHTKNAKAAYCEYCGRRIYSRFKTHEECLIKYSIEKVKNKERIDNYLLKRLCSRGLSVKMLKEMLDEGMR